MEKNYQDKLERAAKILRNGGIVVVATETFYGIAADPFCKEAVERIFLTKNRQLNKPLPLIASSVKNVSGIISEESEGALKFGKNYWPGSLTILLNLTAVFPGCLQDRMGRVGVRVPPLCPARRLAELGTGWITATSANLSGGDNAARIEDIPSSVMDSVDFVVDTGPTEGGLPSTVMALESGQPVIYRQGAVDLRWLKT